MYDVQTTRAAYRTDYQPVNAAWLVHSGFQTVYHGIRREAFRAVNQGLAVLRESNITDFDFVITAHSLGTAVGYLTLLDILRAPADDSPQTDAGVPRIPDSSNITIALFGAPRVANKPFVEHFRELVQERRRRTGRKEALTEWSVIGHLDGTYHLDQLFVLIHILQVSRRYPRFPLAMSISVQRRSTRTVAYSFPSRPNIASLLASM